MKGRLHISERITAEDSPVFSFRTQQVTQNHKAQTSDLNLEIHVGFGIKGWGGATVGLNQMMQGRKYRLLVLCLRISGENEKDRKL